MTNINIIDKCLDAAKRLTDALSERGYCVAGVNVSSFSIKENRTVDDVEISAGRYAKLTLDVYAPVEEEPPSS
jgi:hypothetical protein